MGIFRYGILSEKLEFINYLKKRTSNRNVGSSFMLIFGVMTLNKINTRKSLNPQFRKHKPKRNEVNDFRNELKSCLVSVKEADKVHEEEGFMKTPITTFLKNTFYQDNLVNSKGKIDLAIYRGKDFDSNVAVIIETKRPSNTSEFLTNEDINRKALHELLLYYLRERIDNENNNIKTLIATNGYEWYLFKGEDFYKYFYKKIALVKEYTEWKNKQKDSSKTDSFYNDIAKKYIAEVESELPFVYLNFTKKALEEYTDESLNTLYKVFSDVNILGIPFGNDSNKLNKSFYNELLHIIGLEEKKDKGKKIIYRKDDNKKDYSSLLENTIFKLEGHLSRVKNYSVDKEFNVGLTLCLTWINRILFLKLLESQLQTYHPDEKEKYSFLNSDFIRGFDDLNELFFFALAKKQEDRHSKFKDKYQYIPYLNSSLFERSGLETDTIEISALNDEEIEVYKTTVLKENGKRFKGKLSTLEYLFRFLGCFDFATDGTEGISDEEESKTLINASVLGLIFEKINGYKEGSFYTPSYITMYMCKETLRRAIVQKFQEKENEKIDSFDKLTAYCHDKWEPEDKKRLNSIFNSLKLCDPAVGSGHFLVSALNELIKIKHELGLLIDAKGKRLSGLDIHIENDELYVTDEEGHLIEYKRKNDESVRVQHTLFHEKQTLIENCLFGVDINPNSVKICRLRLWIELLKNAYYTKQGVLQTLPNIDINIKCGNSLISRFDLKDDLQNAFKGKEVKYNFTDYKKAVQQYKGSNSKEQKKEVLGIINEVKNNFISSLDHDTILDKQKAVGKYETEKARQDNLLLFEEKITTADNKILKDLKAKADKAIQKETEIVNNKIYDNSFEWRFEFPEVLDEGGNYIGFDLIIGNPPYGVSIKGNEREHLVSRISKVPDYEIYYWFIERSKQLLKNMGSSSI
jgi:adenine-specific DNA-methyltransferase